MVASSSLVCVARGRSPRCALRRTSSGRPQVAVEAVENSPGSVEGAAEALEQKRVDDELHGDPGDVDRADASVVSDALFDRFLARNRFATLRAERRRRPRDGAIPGPATASHQRVEMRQATGARRKSSPMPHPSKSSAEVITELSDIVAQGDYPGAATSRSSEIVASTTLSILI